MSSPPPGPDLRPARKNAILNLFFGRATELDRGSLRLLRLVALGVAFENYDIGLVNSALPQIAESLGLDVSATGFHLGTIRLGGLGALLLLPFADRIGRRRTFLIALLGMSLGTFATGFVQTPLQFVALQIVTRAFMLTAAAVSVVILVEEFPAHQRGAAVGLLSLLGGVGYGLGAGLYAAVEALPYGWRSLYWLGGAALLLLPFFRREIRETRRFEQHVGLGGFAGFAGWLEPLREFARTHPGRAATIALAGTFASMGSISVFQYTSLFVQQGHGWAPGQYSLLVLGGGLIGMFGTVVGGRGSDRFGRRTVGFLAFAAAPLAAAAFFLGPSAWLALSWGLYVLCMSAGDVIVRALAAELFPTSHRGTSGGALIAVQAIGFAAGLFVVGLFADSFEKLGFVVSVVAGASLIAGLCVLALPETHQRELESISGEAALETRR